MNSFLYHVPTKVYFGEGAEEYIGEALISYGFHKILLHYGGGSIRKNGLYDKVVAQLEKHAISYVELGGVEPNPKITLVREGIDLCRREGVEFILGVGGGSVSDSAKAIALGLAVDQDPWEAITQNIEPKTPFPMGLVLTIAAAGSEMSNSCVITNAENNLKRGCNHPGNRPLVAFMNPVYTTTVPRYQTAAGTVDILMHTMERYLTADEATPLTDGIAEALLNRVKECGSILMKDPENLSARTDMMWASSLAHNDLTGCGRNKTFTAHKIEHDFSGVHDEITHGAGLAVIFPAWCRHEYKKGMDRFYQWAVRIWQAKPGENKEQTILEGIDNMVAYFDRLGMPTTMGQLGIGEEEYESLSSLTTDQGRRCIPSFGGSLTQKEIQEIYRLAE